MGKRIASFVGLLILVGAFVYVFDRAPLAPDERTAAGAPSSAPGTSAPKAAAAASTGDRAPEESATLTTAQANALAERALLAQYKPLNAIKEDFSTRTMRDVYGDLSARASAGDATAAYTLAQVLAECEDHLLNEKKYASFGETGSVAADNALKKNQQIARDQCRQLTGDELAAYGEWALMAAEAGDRNAMLSLYSYPPKNVRPQSAQYDEWLGKVRKHLTTLAEANDPDAALKLAETYHGAAQPNLELARKYYTQALAAARNDAARKKIEFALRDVETRLQSGAR